MVIYIILQSAFALDPFLLYRDITTLFVIEHLCFSLGNSPYVCPESRTLRVHNTWFPNENWGSNFELVWHQELLSENLYDHGAQGGGDQIVFDILYFQIW